MITGQLLAHGVGSREDLPLPFSYALAGAVVALVVSFLALGLLWKTPRLDPETAGWELPATARRGLESRAVRRGVQALGLVITAYVTMAAVVGKDDALNPTAGVVYVLFWIGVPLLCVLVGPVWRVLNPIRTVHALLSRAIGTRPEQGIATMPPALGAWPAAVTLLAFAWLELIAPGNDTLPVLRAFFAAYFALNLLAATYWGSGWFERGDGFEVYFTLAGRLSPIGRRADGRLVLRNPLVSAAGTPVVPGLFAVVGVLLGSTAYDSLSNAPWWIRLVQGGALPVRVTETLGLLAVVTAVTLAFTLAAALSGRFSDQPERLTGEFAHTLVPIVIGYVVAHYWSLLVLTGQTTLVRLSDPLGHNSNWLGTAHWGIDARLADVTFVAVLQASAIVTGHVLGVILAHDRAVRLLPRRHAVAGQVPLLVLMVAYTVTGLSLLFGA